MRLALVIALLATLLVAPTAHAGLDCVPWEQRVVATDLGVLENLEFDGSGGLLLSANSRRAILRLTPSGAVETVVADVDAPGGQRVRGRTLFFNTGDSARSGAMGLRDGTIQRLDLDTGERSTYASGLTMPNGLVFLPNGDAVVSRDLGTGTRLTRVPASNPSQPEFNWAGREDHNGLAVDTTKEYLYADETFVADSSIWRIRIDRPSEISRVAKLGDGQNTKALDDMTIDGTNLLYVTAQATGSIIRVDPRRGGTCEIATGLQNPSAVKFGRGPGWSKRSLYVTGFDGTVRELTPPRAYTPPDGRPVIKLRVSPTRVRAGVRTRMRFTTTVNGKPLEGASVRFGTRRVSTNARGRAVMTVRLSRRRDVVYGVASKPGYRGYVYPVDVR